MGGSDDVEYYRHVPDSERDHYGVSVLSSLCNAKCGRREKRIEVLLLILA
jgi:hypothetical protein